jgi:hypothetical protein
LSRAPGHHCHEEFLLKPAHRVFRFESWFGPYRWNKVGYVLTTQGAMEHSTSIHYPRSIANGTLAYEDVMAHELATSGSGTW